ncbi:DUF2642 domain-containing protein [Priestia aryabhattai]|jgi:hypothetical protein|uniref:DUF2642 domain-containing protein n=1 Tax=Bacillaceae TaxID=186817 RepID=UPI000BA00AB8|nr:MULTISPECIES: DUF2642 domain-containing protein [Bacillaceae]MDT2046094.1 DUF2642 domain-containing protein [Priestia flexa]OZT11950.1 DUF2642 domain-containing protein [Priestia aryabhattai]TDB50202.1 DUF2642 domain-containing protein [Bacillus sp. CBEL-1]USY53874.1 DUF2642 domain-containing protein [Bacillus sp. 1780r2a1]
MWCYSYYRLKKKIKRLLFSKRFGTFIENSTKKAVEEVVYSQRFRDYFIQLIREADVSPFKEIALQYLNEEVVISTVAGPLQGTVTEVGDDYLRLTESATSSVLLPFTSIITIQKA